MGKVLMAGIVPLLTAPTTGSSPDVPDPDVPSEPLLLSSFPEGQIVTINENGSPIPFYLAKHNYESGLNGAGRVLFVRKNGYDQRRINPSYKNTYSNSEMDTFLNGTYKALLDSAVQNAMGTTTFYCIAGLNATSASTLARSVFLLSAVELGGTWTDGSATTDACRMEGSLLPIADTLRSLGVSFWTRTRATENNSGVYFISDKGTVNANGCQDPNYYSRPAFTLPSTMLVDATPNADGSINLLL